MGLVCVEDSFLLMFMLLGWLWRESGCLVLPMAVALCLVQVVEPLLWCCVSMEFCVPLMAVKYLSLRSNLYAAVCQCYYAIQQPLQAEVSTHLYGLWKVAVLDKLRLK